MIKIWFLQHKILGLAWLLALLGQGAQAAGLEPPAYLTADAGKQRVTLNWGAVPGARAFNIYYATAPGVSKSNSTKLADAHSMFILRNLKNDTTYYFALSSVGAQGESALSAELSATPSAKPAPPAPISVRASPEPHQVRLSWSPGFEASPEPTTYTVYYSSTARINKATAQKVSATATPVVVDGLSNGTAYYFAVTAQTAAGESALSYELSATPVGEPPPGMPTGLRAREGNAQITLTWDNSADAASYNLYYGTEPGVGRSNGVKIAGVKSPHVLRGLKNRAAYYVVLSAVNPNGESANSQQVSATPMASQPRPTLVVIPAGSFLMGDNQQSPDAKAPYALPVHKVTLGAFAMARHETSYALWKSVYDWAVSPARGSRVYQFDNPGQDGAIGQGSHMPVTTVSWFDVVKWLNARSEKEGKTPVYYTDASHAVVYRSGRINLGNDAVKWSANRADPAKTGYRLPTDAEWEYAARGGLQGRVYPWGDTLTAANANFDRGLSTAVGSYAANGYGLHDMAGNVWEWTWDRWAANYQADAAGVRNPHGPDDGEERTRRGGSYVYGERYLRIFDRMSRPLDYKGSYFGFRCASSRS